MLREAKNKEKKKNKLFFKEKKKNVKSNLVSTAHTVEFGTIVRYIRK